jgi:predicted PurR-regulated permease PerM
MQTPGKTSAPSKLIEAQPNTGGSPKWSITTKFVVGLSLAAIFVGLVVTFRNIIGPLILAFVLSYLLYPMADFLRTRVRMGWRVAVSLIFLVMLLILIALLTWGGISLVEQIGALIRFLETQLNNLPQTLDQLAATPIVIGPYKLDLNTVEINSIITQALGTIQPLFSRVGGVFTTFASTTAVTIGWIAFILLISYFVLVESGGNAGQIIVMDIPGYEEDILRMRLELGRIWNAFLRGQLIIILLIVGTYSVLLGTLGVSYFYGLALLAGLARFIPYVGPAVAWTVYGLVSYFQGSTLLGMPPLPYALMVVGVAWVTDMVMDNFVAPRLLGNALKVHPAAVMIAALVAASLLGVIGVILAAPVLATAKLVLEYTLKKLSDKDPWIGMETIQPAPPIRNQIASLFQQAGKRLNQISQIKRKM